MNVPKRTAGVSRPCQRLLDSTDTHKTQCLQCPPDTTTLRMGNTLVIGPLFRSKYLLWSAYATKLSIYTAESAHKTCLKHLINQEDTQDLLGLGLCCVVPYVSGIALEMASPCGWRWKSSQGSLIGSILPRCWAESGALNLCAPMIAHFHTNPSWKFCWQSSICKRNSLEFSILLYGSWKNNFPVFWRLSLATCNGLILLYSKPCTH